jgi:hypothetical protein
VIVLDHNIPEDQAEQPCRWRVHFRQIGFEVGRPEWGDQQQILRYLHRARRVTFFTRDLGFFRRQLCHSNYCLVGLTVPVLETALYSRRLLRDPTLRSMAGRQGKVVKVSTRRIVVWQAGQGRLISHVWG